jgi:serine/threonine protein kinase
MARLTRAEFATSNLIAIRLQLTHPARILQVALKKISRKYTNSSTFKTETDALLRIYDNGGHPNISGLRDMYEDHHHYYLILDLVTGGEMFEHLINYGAYSEADAARLMHEIASALAFLHGVGVVHADLKPENRTCFYDT